MSHQLLYRGRTIHLFSQSGVRLASMKYYVVADCPGLWRASASDARFNSPEDALAAVKAEIDRECDRDARREAARADAAALIEAIPGVERVKTHEEHKREADELCRPAARAALSRKASV